MNILTADIGSTYTKLTAINLTKQAVEGTAMAFTTIQTDVMEGFSAALQALEQKIGRFDYDELFCCSSAAGGLKMIALGLVPELTAKAARLAAASAGAKVVKTYAFELSKAEQQEIEEIHPDLVLLCGGTDGGNKEVIITNAHILCELKSTFTTIVAGNKSAASEIEKIFTSHNKQFVITENVMPEFNKLNIEPAQKKITELFINSIIEAKGLSQIQALTKHDIIPTPLAVLNGCKLLAGGTDKTQGLGDMLAVDLGGATTDVYSIADGKPTMENVTVRGLPEPFAKRTVEGDLGMRYSLESLAETLNVSQLEISTGINVERINQWISTVTNNPKELPAPSSEELQIEQHIAHHAVKIAVERHVGTFEPVYTPFGQIFVLTGKDLSDMPYVIGIGGAIINSINPASVLKGAVKGNDDLMYAKPAKPAFLIDENYIFSSMGLLSSAYPEATLNMLKNGLMPA